jgi:hypothetical protein
MGALGVGKSGVSKMMSTPEQKCIGFPERKYINDAGKKAPDWRPSL